MATKPKPRPPSLPTLCRICFAAPVRFRGDVCAACRRHVTTLPRPAVAPIAKTPE